MNKREWIMRAKVRFLLTTHFLKVRPKEASNIEGLVTSVGVDTKIFQYFHHFFQKKVDVKDE